MGKKSIAVIVFIVVTIGFLYGFVTYNRQLREMLDKEISPQVVVMPDETEKPQPPVTETPPISEQDTEETEEEEEETSELVVIPYIIGLHKEDAVKALEDRNLVPEIHLEYVEGVEKEYVFYQRPPRNQEVPAGTTVSFSVSRGPYGSSDTETKVMMPIVMGKTRAQAEKVLVETGLLVKIRESYSSEVVKGNVISSDTAAGKEVRKGSTVIITVSLGKEPVEKVMVPDVTGRARSEAVSLLESAGLTVRITEAYSDTVPEGMVMAQNPGAVLVEPGTTVNLTISKGKESEPDLEEPEEPADPADPEDPGTPING
ncbi:PASTA domain-containing protein [Proteiniclasticum sp. SCR006]|uniref:PASTA domain-containing protein n=1 Tax=Proteiniclasticum aestuarii TaxID=2817862 RepID=A0A939HAK4_9CLOT|nr:PASTA domain-containing protein [Proteiniclasticum aestuarii]MBO1264080.1 PASTA domain-containing protein [Proteiniclasticum aestuarii]